MFFGTSPAMRMGTEGRGLRSEDTQHLVATETWSVQLQPASRLRTAHVRGRVASVAGRPVVRLPDRDPGTGLLRVGHWPVRPGSI